MPALQTPAVLAKAQNDANYAPVTETQARIDGDTTTFGRALALTLIGLGA